jgi:hypothetical protein
LPRAKRTTRAEARRRYRASLADPIDDRDLDEFPDEPIETAGRSRRSDAAPSRSAAGAAPRPGIFAAFRASFRPLDLRGDLRALPQLVRHPSFLVAVILSGLSVALIPLVGSNAATATLYQYFSYSTPLGTAFIAGFFAPRASYLLGILAALASVGFQAIAFSSGTFGGLLAGGKDASGNPLAPNQVASLILGQALFIGVPWSAFFAAAAAWYRRFLRTANPNRQSRQAAAPSRRPDGKVPKSNEPRPLLARRR